jgi:tetratricopeptide (TPR) repeat protein
MEGNIDLATQDAEAAIALTASSQDLLRRDALLTAAKTLYNRHENQRALELTEEARRITWQQDDTIMYPELLDMLGLLYNRLGDLEKSEQTFRMVLDPALGAAPYRLARTWGRLGEISLLLGDIASAIDRFQTGLQFAREAQDNWALAQILVHLGESLLKVDRLDAAAEAFTEAMQIRLIAGERLGIGACLQGLARVHLAHGDLKGAIRVFQQGIQHCRDIPDHRLLFRLLTSCACALDQNGDRETAEQYANEVMAILREGRGGVTKQDMTELSREIAHLRSFVARAH